MGIKNVQALLSESSDFAPTIKPIQWILMTTSIEKPMTLHCSTAGSLPYHITLKNVFHFLFIIAHGQTEPLSYKGLLTVKHIPKLVKLTSFDQFRRPDNPQGSVCNTCHMVDAKCWVPMIIAFFSFLPQFSQ